MSGAKMKWKIVLCLEQLKSVITVTSLPYHKMCFCFSGFKTLLNEKKSLFTLSAINVKNQGKEVKLPTSPCQDSLSLGLQFQVRLHAFHLEWPAHFAVSTCQSLKHTNWGTMNVLSCLCAKVT